MSEHGRGARQGLASAVRVGWCKTSAGDLRFLFREGRGIPIVALPGAAGRAEHVLMECESPYLALDWPGSGESTAALPRWSTSGLAALVAETFSCFGWSRVVVVGHSLGAMVASHLALDPRVLGVVLLAPMPGLLQCVRAGVWPFPVRSIFYLILSALSLCNFANVHEASRSDLNRAWLLHGLEGESMSSDQWHSAEEQCRPRADAPSGFLVWFQRRLGDVAALFAILTHLAPSLRGKKVWLSWGERDLLIDSRASQLAADSFCKGERGRNSAAQIVRTVVSAHGGHFLHWTSPELFAATFRDIGALAEEIQDESIS
eukprot:TRINITY_DN34767_c0_g1_i1.p1 TRINITY_DN34767_c0_g1~~TRINITY_DN34767_c0_g1_i1.p1  ORF type:complete len:317 (+),score=48.18 TRINITY_DN34767_c0_g1_i1:110-1060(+)